ncbi:uncharacterized protein LOC123877685 [Maniola jurtina]|uniref:uncharacterized protein LOC123877685 n=1 Tax=Maniola jurtina TaxID=191418 RepID=UPI001E68CE23|nr:uncharacterized protein LOC123877685 [Maniola jurtina]
MENLKIITICDDGSCCCLSLKGTVILIAVIGLLTCLLDKLSNDTSEASCGGIRKHLVTLRNLLLALNQMANMLLLLGSIVENAPLLSIYLWQMLASIVLGFVVSIVEFCFRVREEGAWGFATFVLEVIHLFVLFRCLPLVDTYRKRLKGLRGLLL